jgi:signal transduction histidine kinase
LVKQAKSYETEKRYVREDGSTVWASVSASPIRDVQGKVKSAVIVVVDITSRKKAEAALRRSRELLEELVQQRTNALHAANVELQNEINLRKGLEEQILEISDREQQRLARELHDGLCQQLTAIGFMARATALRLKNHRVVQVEDLEKIAQLITNSVMDARGIARDLHKEEVDAAGLAEVLRALSERKIWRIPCRFDLKTELNIEDDRVASQLYRILREALMNANKHANATQLVLEVRRRKNDLIFAVTDNGVGFSAKTKTGRGLGLHIMQYRAQSIGARLKLESPRNGGARVVCSLPSQNEICETK